MNIVTLIILCFFLKEPNVFSDGCSLDLIENWDLSPISEIYLSNEKTSDTLKLGYLDEYSNEDIEVSSAEIYKWKNKYINVKREKSSNPINYIEISEVMNPIRSFNYKTIRIYNDYYLHYSSENYNGEILYDLKVSFREKYHSNQKKFSNICFSYFCAANLGICLNNDTFEIIDSDDTDNFISYNKIKLKIKNSEGYYHPGEYHLFKRNKIHNENADNNINKIKKLFIAYLILNPILRIVKLLFSCFLTVGKGYCSCLNFIYTTAGAINFSLVLCILIFSSVNDDDYEGSYNNYLEGLKFPLDIIFYLFIFECYIFFGSFYFDSESFSEEPKCSCGCDSSPFDSPEINEHLILEKNKFKEKIKLNEEKVNKCNSEKNELNKLLEQTIYEERMLNSNEHKKILNIYTKRKLTIKLEEYKHINDTMTELQNKLNERKAELDQLKNNYNEKILPGINSLFNGKKLKLNCIYLDENINVEEDFSSSYEFFKILKNSIEGVFFGIKSEEDFYYIDVQIPEELKFILIFSTNNKQKANDFLMSYHSKFSQIFIFTIDPKEFNDLKNDYKNIISIESDYDSLALKLIKLKENYVDRDNIYKPYDLNLYSDYLSNDQIKQCHQILLDNTLLGEDLNKLKKSEFKKGLSKEEYLKFVSFIDNLDDKTTKEQNENQQFNINHNIIKDEEEEDIKINLKMKDKEEDIKINIKLKDNNESRRNGDKESRINENNESRRNENEIRIYDNTKRSDSSYDINQIENLPNISKIVPIIRRKIRIVDNPEESEAKELNIVPASNLINISKKKEPLGKISDKEKIKKSLMASYNSSEELVNLYTLNDGKFYLKLNDWLRTFNIKIYTKIGPITGKIMNLLYFEMMSNKIENKKEKLYRGLTIKKADIFLYKACEGDIFFYPAFTSTSNDSSESDKFKNKFAIDIKKLDEKCNCLIEINYNARDRDVLQEADIAKYSKYDFEQERLFPPYSFFKIKKVLFNSGYKDGKKLDIKETFNGTFERPFKIELELIRRNFYLDEALAKNKNFKYIKKSNMWELKN